MTDIVKFNSDSGSLEKMRSPRGKNIGYPCHEQIAPCKMLLGLSAGWTFIKETIGFSFTLFCKPIHVVIIPSAIIRYVKSLPKVSNHQQSQRNMQSRIGLIPSKPLSMSRGSQNENESQGYDYPLHNSILSLNLKLSREAA